MKTAWFAVCIALSPLPALAGEGWGGWGGLYGEIYGGGRLAGLGFFESDAQYAMDLGPAYGVSAGVLTPVPGLAVELDVFHTDTTFMGYPTDHFSSTSVMIDGEYSVPVNDSASVYALAGLGMINTRFYQDDGTPDGSGWGAGYQFGAGGRVKLTDQLSVFSEVKYRSTFQPVDAGVGDKPLDPSVSALVGLRLSMN